jgi:hypothetical protein
MSDQVSRNNLAPVTRQARAIEGRSGRRKVTGKLRKAIEAMVWEGSCRPHAAKSAGLQDHSLREALRKPHVKAFYRAELEVLRTSERARNIHALARIRDQDENKMAVVAAVKAMEQMEPDGPAGSTGQPAVPGFVFLIRSEGDKPRIIDMLPPPRAIARSD